MLTASQSHYISCYSSFTKWHKKLITHLFMPGKIDNLCWVEWNLFYIHNSSMFLVCTLHLQGRVHFNPSWETTPVFFIQLHIPVFDMRVGTPQVFSYLPKWGFSYFITHSCDDTIIIQANFLSAAMGDNSDERSPLLGPRIASLRQSEVSM